MSEAKKTAKTMPKGGRKGGAVFPRINLKVAVGYAKKLVSKTHSGPQPKDVIYSGVLGSAGSASNAKISALKQYGFVIGDTENGFSASDDAKQLVASPPEELLTYYRAAVLRPKIFKTLFDTYHGDAVTAAKLKQRAAGLNVHPDETETCVEMYLQSVQLAALVTVEGDSYRHVAHSQVKENTAKKDDAEEEDEGLDGDRPQGPSEADGESVSMQDEGAGRAAETGKPADDVERSDRGSSPRAIFNVNVTLDSSLDTEKLQKQLELLKKFGAI